MKRLRPFLGREVFLLASNRREGSLCGSSFEIDGREHQPASTGGGGGSDCPVLPLVSSRMITYRSLIHHDRNQSDAES